MNEVYNSRACSGWGYTWGRWVIYEGDEMKTLRVLRLNDVTNEVWGERTWERTIVVWGTVVSIWRGSCGFCGDCCGFAGAVVGIAGTVVISFVYLQVPRCSKEKWLSPTPTLCPGARMQHVLATVSFLNNSQYTIQTFNNYYSLL